MNEKPTPPEDKWELNLNRKDFLNLMTGVAAGIILPGYLSSLLGSSSSSSLTTALSTSPNWCYIRLFNTLNYQEAHFPPPEHPNETKLFDKFITLFKHLLNSKENHFFLQQSLSADEYKKFTKIIKTKPYPSDDLITMVMSSVTTKDNPPPVYPYEPVETLASDTLDNCWEQFTTWFKGQYGSLKKEDYRFLVETVLTKKLHLAILVKEDKKNPYKSIFKCCPLIFGMGEKDFEKFLANISQLLIPDASDPQHGKKAEFAQTAYDLVEKYQFGEVHSAKLYKAWNPPLYRCLPAQLDSAVGYSGYDGLIKNDPLKDDGQPLWATGYADWISPILWDWDKLVNVIKHNKVDYTQWVKCGCMCDQAVISDGKHTKRAQHFLEISNPDKPGQNFCFCTSLRQKKSEIQDAGGTWFPTLDANKNELGPNLKRDMQVAEDYNLMHQIYNFKESDDKRKDDYTSWICNCHRNWCLQLRPRNEYWGEIPNNECIKVGGILRTSYKIELTGNCGDCNDCYNTEEPADNSIKFVCPVHAFDNAGKTGKIDYERCLGCFLCVRHCYRKHGKVSDVSTRGNHLTGETRGIKVSRVLSETNLSQKIPRNRWDLDQQRIAAVYSPAMPKMNWPKYRYTDT